MPYPWMPGDWDRGLMTEGQEYTFWGDMTVLYLVCVGAYTNVDIC